MSEDSSAAARSHLRLVSLDIFRGATIAAMILVNNAGNEPDSYWLLRHADWNGWTPADLIFPFFLFIVGASMAFSFAARLERGQSRLRLVKHVIQRGAILFALGLFLNGFPNQYSLATLRVYGILQRIAICYVSVALCALYFRRRAWLALAVALLIGYWVLLRYLPLPGLGVPGRDIPLLDPDRNIAAWLDRRLLAGHLFAGTRDPEGILSTIPAIVTALIGLLAGDRLHYSESKRAKTLQLLIAGVVCMAAGKLWNLSFPINKNLWTSSFALFTAGIALLCLAACYWIIDVQNWRGPSTKFFLVFGTNAIAAYVFAEMASLTLYHFSAAAGLSWQEVLYQNGFEPWLSPALASLLYSLCYVFFCWAVMWLLYRKRIFVKI